MKFEFACGDGQEREGDRVTTNQPRVFPEDLLHLPRRLKPWRRARQVKLAHRRTTPEGDESSAPFGWKASGLQALPAGLFFCFFGASGLPASSGCGGIPPKCVRMQVRSTRPCSAVGRYIPLHEASCVRRAGRRSGRKLCYRRPNDETAPGGPSGTVNASGRRSCPPETSRT